MLPMYFDAAVLEFERNVLLFRFALAILWDINLNELLTAKTLLFQVSGFGNQPIH